MAISTNSNMAQNQQIDPKDKTKRIGSGFTNMSRIIDANKDNRLGQAISSGITGGATETRQQLGDARNQFQQASAQGNLNSDANKQAREAALNQIKGGNTNVSDATANQFGVFQGGQYQGPNQLDSNKVAQIGSKASELGSYAQGIRSGGDSSGALKAFVGKGPNYSVGEQRLDSVLLGNQNQGQQQQLSQARRQASSLTPEVQRAQDQARGLAETATGQSKTFGQDTANQVTGVGTDVETGINQRLQDYQSTQGDFLNRIQQKFNSGQSLTPEEKTALGLNQAQTYAADGVDLNSLLSAKNLTAGAAATDTQKAQLGALARLAQKGVQDFTKVDTTTQGLDKNSGLFNFDANELQKRAQDQVQRYNTDLNTKDFGSNVSQNLQKTLVANGLKESTDGSAISNKVLSAIGNIRGKGLGETERAIESGQEAARQYAFNQIGPENVKQAYILSQVRAAEQAAGGGRLPTSKLNAITSGAAQNFDSGKVSSADKINALSGNNTGNNQQVLSEYNKAKSALDNLRSQTLQSADSLKTSYGIGKTI